MPDAQSTNPQTLTLSEIGDRVVAREKCDKRTFYRVAAGEHVRGRVAERIQRALAEYGVGAPICAFTRRVA